MQGYEGPGVEAMWDGAPTDFNIREDFPVEALERALVAFAKGRGASTMTITCANAALTNRQRAIRRNTTFCAREWEAGRSSS